MLHGVSQTSTGCIWIGTSHPCWKFRRWSIIVYNKNGQFKGQLGDEDGDVITIDGLWALEFKPGAFNGTSDPDLYFTAGPDNEEHGIFGEIEFEGEEQ